MIVGKYIFYIILHTLYNFVHLYVQNFLQKYRYHCVFYNDKRSCATTHNNCHWHCH